MEVYNQLSDRLITEWCKSDYSELEYYNTLTILHQNAYQNINQDATPPTEFVDGWVNDYLDSLVK